MEQIVSRFIARFLFGPVSTLALIGQVELASRLPWYSPTLALPFAGLAISTWFGGLRSNLISATFITVYALLTTQFDPVRTGQVGIAAFSVAIVCGYLRRIERRASDNVIAARLAETEAQAAQREAEIAAREARIAEIEAAKQAEENQWKADQFDSINGNLERLEKVHKLLEDLYRGWEVLKDDAKQEKIDEARGMLASLRTMAEGWHAMHEERERLKLENERAED